MMFKKLIYNATGKIARKEQESFLSLLRSGTDGELGMGLAAAALIRERLKNGAWVKGHFPDAAFLGQRTISSDLTAALSAYTIELIHLRDTLVRSSNPVTNALGGGVTVYIASFRALTRPELFVLGRAIWKELLRGAPHYLDAIAQYGSMLDANIPEEQARALFPAPNILAPVGEDDMIGAPKEKTQPPEPIGAGRIVEVIGHLQRLGFDITPCGERVALREIEGGSSDVGVASHVALVTMALDIKEVGSDIFLLMQFGPRAVAIAKVLNDYKDRGLLTEAQWNSVTNALRHLVNVNPEQVPWIEKILSDPIAAEGRLAKSRFSELESFPSLA